MAARKYMFLQKFNEFLVMLLTMRFFFILFNPLTARKR